MANELITVIVPVHNLENYIEDCVQSILAQTHQNLEILLIDDASTDNSLQILYKMQKNDVRIHVIHCEKNMRQGRVRHLALDYIYENHRDELENHFFCQVDGDDTIEPEFCATLLELLKNNPSCAIAGCDWVDLYADGVREPHFYHFPESQLVFSGKEAALAWASRRPKRLVETAYSHNTAHLYRSSVVPWSILSTALGGVRPLESKLNMIIYYSTGAGLIVIPKPLYIAKQRAGSDSHAGWGFEHDLEFAQYLNDIWKDYKVIYVGQPEIDALRFQSLQFRAKGCIGRYLDKRSKYNKNAMKSAVNSFKNIISKKGELLPLGLDLKVMILCPQLYYPYKKCRKILGKIYRAIRRKKPKGMF